MPQTYDDAGRAARTRSAILRAAEDEFAASGFRRSSMSAVAGRAGLSRATVYLHWSSKEELFVDLVATLHRRHLDEMRRVVDDPPADLAERLTAILAARFGQFVALTSASEHAEELYDVHDRLCGDVAGAANLEADRLTALLVRRAQRSGEVDLSRSGLSVPRLVRVLNDCAHGAKAGAGDALAGPDEFRKQLLAVVRALVTGIGAPVP